MDKEVKHMTVVLSFFTTGSSEYTLLVLIFLAALMGVYLYGLSRRPQAPADEVIEQYRHLTAEKLAATPDDQLVRAVVANILAKQDHKRPNPYRDIPLLSPGRCGVYSVWLLLKEWEKGQAGGFASFLAGPSGQFASLAADGLDILGAPLCAQAVRQAIDGDTAAADQQFSSALEQEDPAELSVQYIRDNIDQFVD